MKRLLVFAILLNCQFLIVGFLAAQTSGNAKSAVLNSQYSSMPIPLPLSMSGDFAEIRPNHFHSGLDIRTDGEEGKPVYAPADGYVSRINISPWGGGRVLYITHPDGYRTVYMHLSAFCGKIGQYVHDYQYGHRCYAFDTELPRDSIRVRKGELVALTGNSGGSMGPHLHYEIRLAVNDQAINPLHFGLHYSDHIPPTIAGIKIYPSTSGTTINGRNRELKLSIGKSGKNAQDVIRVSGRFYTGIYAYDQMEAASRNKNGVERIELYVDDSLFHSFSVPSFLFEETRAVNAIIDYREYQRTREYYILSRRLHGDLTNFNSVTRDMGHLQFDDSDVHKLQYRVFDYKGNSTSSTFFVRNSKGDNVNVQPEDKSIQVSGDPIAYYKPFHLVREGFGLAVEAYNIYENDYLIYHTSSDPEGITQQHHVTPLRHPLPPHDRIHVTLAIPDKVPHQLRSKLVAVCVDGKRCRALQRTEHSPSAEPAMVNGIQVVNATSRSWGAFALRLDTIAPSIHPLGFTENRLVRGKTLSVKIGDNLSGVEHYSCTVNDNWHVVEYDGKTSSLILETKLLQKGRNTLIYTVTDAVGNTATKTFTVFRQ